MNADHTAPGRTGTGHAPRGATGRPDSGPEPRGAAGRPDGGARTSRGAQANDTAPAPLPVPPADGRTVKACCAELWAHPVVRLLAGDAFRPGGAGLTDRLLESVDLPAGARVLDVGCGAGATLRLLAGRGLVPVGVDYAPTLAAEAAEAVTAAGDAHGHLPARGWAVAGDAESLPWRAGAFDGVLVECVLSALPDKPAALAETARVLRPGGVLVLSDITLSGPLAEPLGSLAAWVACTAGALEPDGYVRLLEAAGFTVEHVEDHGRALAAMVSKARRRLALLRGAAATGILDAAAAAFAPAGSADTPWPLLDPGADPAEVAEALLAQTAEAVAAGTLGYVAVVARRDG